MPKVSEEYRASRREQILTAAMRCAAREGFHKTTMAAVIRESGLSAGAVYLYFSGKQELIRAVAATAVSEIADTLSSLATDADRVPTPEEALHATTARILEVAGARGVDVSRLALQAWAEAARDPAVLTVVQEKSELIREAWTGYAAAAVAAGHLAPDTDPTEVALTLMGLLPGFILLRLTTSASTPQQYAAGLAALRRTTPAH